MMQENAGMLLKNMENQRDSISSVSLDEEAANLIRFQRAYEAAAQYISVVNDLMEILMQIA